MKAYPRIDQKFDREFATKAVFSSGHRLEELVGAVAIAIGLCGLTFLAYILLS